MEPEEKPEESKRPWPDGLTDQDLVDEFNRLAEESGSPMRATVAPPAPTDFVEYMEKLYPGVPYRLAKPKEPRDK